MKIWFPTIRTGTGTDIFVRRLVVALGRRGVEATVTWFAHGYEIAPFLLKARPPVGCDLIHANSWYAASVAVPGLPLMATVHLCVHAPEFRPYKTLAQRLYHDILIRRQEARGFRLADLITAVSHDTASSVHQIFGRNFKAPVRIIPNWLDIGVFSPASSAPPVARRPFRLLFVGNWSRRKGGDLLHGLMRRLGQGFELRFTSGMSGPRPPASLLQNMVPTTRANSDASMAELYRDCDALLFPSRLEGFGYAAAEAMACGKPVIGFKVSAVPEVVSDGETGLLCELDDLGSLETACRRLADDAPLRIRLGAAGRQRAVEQFSEEAAMARYLDAYRSLLQ